MREEFHERIKNKKQNKIKKNPSAILCCFQHNYNWKRRPIFAYENKQTNKIQICYVCVTKWGGKYNNLMKTKARSEPGERREVKTVAREEIKEDEEETTSGTAATNQSGDEGG